MIETRTVQHFLSGHRIAVIGASDGKDNFGGTVYRELRQRGYDTVAVNPNADTVAGDRCYPDLASVPGALDGAVVMLSRERAASTVRECAEHDVPRVWLFKGLGGQGAVSDEALEVCAGNGIDVVAGACPLMFLEPLGWLHKMHRGARRHLTHSLS